MKNFLGLWLLVWGSAFAAPVEWDLQNVVFDDGGTATGSFYYDADTGEFSNVAIITSNGVSPIQVGFIPFEEEYVIFQGQSYISGFYNDAQAGRYNFYTQPGPDGLSPDTLALRFASELDQSLSPYTVITGFGESNGGIERDIISGEVVSLSGMMSVPIPSTIWLLGSALAGLARIRHR